MSKFSHLDDQNRPAMVDVGDKQATERQAHARSVVNLPPEVLAELEGDEISTRKGPVFATAIIAGVMAAKKTHELIPFCHPLGLESCKISVEVESGRAIVDCRCRVHHKTGVEMEALTAATVAALTVYDMVKAVDRGTTITDVRLVHKDGGKSGEYRAS